MNNIEQTLSIIKPDAVERKLSQEKKEIFIKNNLKIKKVKKSILPKMKLRNFIRFINLNLFIMIYAIIYLLAQLKLMILEGEGCSFKK